MKEYIKFNQGNMLFSRHKWCLGFYIDWHFHFVYRENNKPSVIYSNGEKYWYFNKPFAKTK